jgi:hypothetical protein
MSGIIGDSLVYRFVCAVKALKGSVQLFCIMQLTHNLPICLTIATSRHIIFKQNVTIGVGFHELEKPDINGCGRNAVENKESQKYIIKVCLSSVPVSHNHSCI